MPSETVGGSTAGGEGDDGVITMVQAPDPAWDWLTDQGIRQEMEEEAGITVLDTNTWDYFGVYAGGHADVTQVATYSLPVLQEETGIPTTAFGKWNTDRTMVLVPTDSEYEDLCQMEGETIAVNTPVQTTLIWGAYVKELCGLDFTPGGGDYDLVLTDAQGMAPLVASGDAAGCICLPDFAIPQLMSGELRGLYDGRSSAQFFQDEFVEHSYDGPQNNLIVAPTEWIEKNPKEAAFLLSLWERGVQEWQENMAEIVSTYPEHFAATNDDEVDFIVDFMQNQFDWFSPTVYLDDAFVEDEQAVVDLLRETGFMEEGAEIAFEIIPPPSG